MIPYIISVSRREDIMEHLKYVNINVYTVMHNKKYKIMNDIENDFCLYNWMKEWIN